MSWAGDGVVCCDVDSTVMCVLYLVSCVCAHVLIAGVVLLIYFYLLAVCCEIILYFIAHWGFRGANDKEL